MTQNTHESKLIILWHAFLSLSLSAHDVHDNLAVQAVVWLSTVQCGASCANLKCTNFQRGRGDLSLPFA